MSKKHRRIFTLWGDIGDGYFVLKSITLSIYYDKKHQLWVINDYNPELIEGCTDKKLRNAVYKYVYLLKNWYNICSKPIDDSYKNDKDYLFAYAEIFINLNRIITHESADAYFSDLSSTLDDDYGKMLQAMWWLTLEEHKLTNPLITTSSTGILFDTTNAAVT